MHKLHMHDAGYVEALVRLADIHDKLGRSKAASERLWEAEALVSAKVSGIATAFGMMSGAAPGSDCAPVCPKGGHVNYAKTAMGFCRCYGLCTKSIQE